LNQDSELPKGMSPVSETPEIKQPVSFSLRRGNYVAAIYHALDLIPVEVRILKCIVIEQKGLPPEVELSLQIVDEEEASIATDQE